MRVGTIQWKELLLSAAAGEGVILILAVIAYDSFFWMLPLQVLLLPIHRLIRENRRRRLHRQHVEGFGQVLQSLMTSLQAGYSLENACRVSLKELAGLYRPDHPTVRQLRQIVRGIELRRSPEQMFMEYARETQIEEIYEFAVVLHIAKSTGGNVVEKPNRLKYVLKQGDHVPTDAEVIAAVDTLIEGYLNCEPYGGSVAEDKGKRRVDVWRENLPNGAVRKPASERDLQLMLMRTSKPVRVTRRGVTLKIHGLELDFYTPELANLRMKDKVYLRYDPEDLSKVRVYDMEDRYLTEAPQSKLTAGYLATQEQIAELMAAKRKAEKAVREYGQALRLPEDPERALNLATALARHNLDELELAPKPNCIELRRAEQEEPLLRAVGDIDIGSMNDYLVRHKGGFDDGEDL